MSAQSAGDEQWSVGRLLDWTQQFFGRKRLESPRLDAELLLSHVLGCTRIQLYTNYDADVGDADRRRFRELVLRRSNYEPVAYLVGTREFYGLSFAVGPHVLIPRPETEHLVDAAVAFLKDREAPTFADVGTGSGCIAIALASEVSQTTGVATDASKEALALAKSNAERHGLADRIAFDESDLLANVNAPAFDLIVSNPPYVAASEWETMAPDVRNWEPKLALDGGDDGLQVYRRLIPAAASKLKLGGRILLEIGSSQESDVLNIIAEASLNALPTVHDYSGHPRVVVAER